MRILGASLVAALPLSLGALIACESESTNNPPPVTLDGSTVDVGTTPTPPDGALPDNVAPSAGVTVTVRGKDGPLAGILVVFNDAAGAVLDKKTTGADGKAASSGATPAMASALLAQSDAKNIVTWTGLEAGDELSVNDIDANAPAGSYDLAVAEPVAGATRYQARIGKCRTTGNAWTGAAPQNHTMRNECLRKENNGVAIDALDNANALLGSAFKKGIAAPGATPVAVAFSAFTAPTNVTVSLANAPAGLTTDTDLHEVVNGIGSQARPVSSNVFATATGFAEAIQAMGYSSNGGSYLVMGQRVTAPVAGNTVALDFANALPRVTAGTASRTDPRRPELSWTTAAPITNADGALVQVSLYGGEENPIDWIFVVPPTATSVKAPAMPPEAGVYFGDPTPPQPSPSTAIGVVYIETDLVPSYAVFRRQQGTFFPASNTLNDIPTLPTNGTFRLSVWTGGGS